MRNLGYLEEDSKTTRREKVGRLPFNDLAVTAIRQPPPEVLALIRVDAAPSAEPTLMSMQAPAVPKAPSAPPPCLEIPITMPSLCGDDDVSLRSGTLVMRHGPPASAAPPRPVAPSSVPAPPLASLAPMPEVVIRTLDDVEPPQPVLRRAAARPLWHAIILGLLLAAAVFMGLFAAMVWSGRIPLT